VRVRELLVANPMPDTGLELPKPKGRLLVEGLSYVAPMSQKPILRGVTFDIAPGEVLGIIGPSGAGKSTLARHIVGVLKPTAGAVRLDGADVSFWTKSSRGAHLGYLPQDIELFADTVAANIARFRTDLDDSEVIIDQNRDAVKRIHGDKLRLQVIAVQVDFY